MNNISMLIYIGVYSKTPIQALNETWLDLVQNYLDILK